ncbi:uncharacterized protein tent5d isoform X2 [Amia ocellicauda]
MTEHSDRRFHNLTREQVETLDQVLTEVIPIHGRGNFPTLEVKPKDIIHVVKDRLVEKEITVRDVRLNGSTASHVLVKENGTSYKDLDIIFGVELPKQEDFQIIKEVVLDCLLDFLPKCVNKDKITALTMKEAYVQKMVKVFTEHDRWSLISLSNNSGKNVELKFVNSLRRQFEFSVDSFQIILDRMLESYQEAEHRRAEAELPKTQATAEDAPQMEDERCLVPAPKELSSMSQDSKGQEPGCQGGGLSGESLDLEEQSSVHAEEILVEEEELPNPSEAKDQPVLENKEPALVAAPVKDSESPGHLAKVEEPLEPDIKSFLTTEPQAPGEEPPTQQTACMVDTVVAPAKTSVNEETVILCNCSSSLPCLLLTEESQDLVSEPPTFAKKPCSISSESGPLQSPLPAPAKKSSSKAPVPSGPLSPAKETQALLNEQLDVTQRSKDKKSFSLSDDVLGPAKKSYAKRSRSLTNNLEDKEKTCQDEVSGLHTLSPHASSQTVIPLAPDQESQAEVEIPQRETFKSPALILEAPANSGKEANMENSSNEDLRNQAQESSTAQIPEFLPQTSELSEMHPQAEMQAGDAPLQAQEPVPETPGGPEVATVARELPVITVVAESMYGDFEQAMDHLRYRLIATRNPEEIRGGGLLKYSNLLVREFRPASETEIKTLERYMCSRFFIDFPDVNEQQRKIESYLRNHFIGEEKSKYDYLMTLRRVVNESTVCLMGHERRQTLNMITILALKVLGEQNIIPNTNNVTCYYQPAPYIADRNFNNYYIAHGQPPLIYHPYPLHIHMQTGLV